LCKRAGFTVVILYQKTVPFTSPATEWTKGGGKIAADKDGRGGGKKYRYILTFNVGIVGEWVSERAG